MNKEQFEELMRKLDAIYFQLHYMNKEFGDSGHSYTFDVVLCVLASVITALVLKKVF